MKEIRILLADDHSIVRTGIAAILGYEKDIAVVGEAEDGEEAIRLARKLSPDIVLMDLMMPGMDGVEATRTIRETLPDTKVLILTTFGTSADVARAIAAGASGAIVKDISKDDLVSAIRLQNAAQRSTYRCSSCKNCQLQIKSSYILLF